MLVLPNAELHERVRVCGPTMIFSGPIQPPMLGAAIASAQLHLSDELESAQAELADLVAHTNDRIAALGLPQVEVSDAPLFFIPTGLPRLVYAIVQRLMADGFYLNAGVFPAVPMKQGGLRFTVHRGLSRADIDRMLERLHHHYHQVLAEEGSSLENVRKAFRMTGIVMPEVAANDSLHAPAEQAAGTLVVRHESSIARFDAARWDQKFAGRGAMTHAALAMMEQVFTAQDDPRTRAEPGYIWIEDERGEVVLATMYTASLTKDDMFARASVSEQLEQVRRTDDPNYLVSKAIVLGTPLSVGDHLWLDRDHPKWREALTTLTTVLGEAKQRAGATKILLRDFAQGADDELRDALLDLGFFEHRLPDRMTIDSMPWADRAAYLAALPQKYRYNVRKEAIAFEERFEIRTEKDVDDAEIDRCYALYRQVHARSYALNVFPLPRDLFAAMFRHPQYDVIRLALREHGPDAPTVAVLISHRAGGCHSALLVGLDGEFQRSHNTYKQALFQCVQRAHALGDTHLDLAFTAELEKKKLGARPRPTCAYALLDDDYALTVIESM